MVDDDVNRLRHVVQEADSRQVEEDSGLGEGISREEPDISPEEVDSIRGELISSHQGEGYMTFC